MLTVPALVIGLTAPLVGRIIDRLGRKRLLVGALVVYAVVGTAPLWLPSLQLIIVSRILVGLTEAAIMTCCTTLLADYFHGAQRQRYFGLQIVYTTAAATVFFAVGELLGAERVAHSVLALRGKSAAGRGRRPLRLAAGPAGAGGCAHREAGAAAVAHPASRRSA